MVDKRVRDLVKDILDTVVDSGHVLVVGHRNVNKMIVKNLLGLSFQEGYEVEHENSWLYIFAPKKAEIFLIKIPAPQDLVPVHPGYKKATLLHNSALS